MPGIGKFTPHRACVPFGLPPHCVWEAAFCLLGAGLLGFAEGGLSSPHSILGGGGFFCSHELGARHSPSHFNMDLRSAPSTDVMLKCTLRICDTCIHRINAVLNIYIMTFWKWILPAFYFEKFPKNTRISKHFNNERKGKPATISLYLDMNH